MPLSGRRKTSRDQSVRPSDVNAVVRLARAAADELVFRAEDPTEPLTLIERRAFLAIAAAVDRAVSRWAGLKPCSADAQAVIDKALAAVLPDPAR